MCNKLFKLVILSLRWFCFSEGHLVESGDIFLCYIAGLVVLIEASDAAKYTALHRTDPCKKELSRQNVDRASIDKLFILFTIPMR